MCSATRNVRTTEFRTLFERLPPEIREAGRAAFERFLVDPAHPSLRVHALAGGVAGRCRPGTISVSITRKYRALYVPTEGVNVWYWIGTHNDYENLTGRK